MKNCESFNRRVFIGAGVATTVGVALSARALESLGLARPETVELETANGRLRGTRAAGVCSFKGVPYGGQVSGSGRFKAAPPVQPWAGVRDATRFGPPAIQPANLMSAMNLGGFDENCLVLNVWTPAIGDHGKRPVMFYCHGGGFESGSGGATFEDGGSLARTHDVVVVSINHRLGLLGYLYLRGLAGDEYATSGNQGMLDIVAALQWVRDNIQTFGGDPASVMIFGESGGGAKVSTLLAMPSAHGLFHKASIESGPYRKAKPREEATAIAETVLAKLGLSRADIGRLRDVPTERLLEVQSGLSGIPGVRNFTPVVDGVHLPQNPFDPVAPEISANIPLIVGTNKDEAIYFGMVINENGTVGSDTATLSLDETGLSARLKPILGANTDRVLGVYRRTRPTAGPADLLFAIETALWMRMEAIRLAELKARQRAAPVYMYMFAYESDIPLPGSSFPMKAMHAMEIPFKFNNMDVPYMAGQRPDRIQAAHNMSEMWANFARTGHPDSPGQPAWPPYSAERRSTMIINAACTVVDDPERDERLLWDDITPLPNVVPLR